MDGNDSLSQLYCGLSRGISQKELPVVPKDRKRERALHTRLLTHDICMRALQIATSRSTLQEF